MSNLPAKQTESPPDTQSQSLQPDIIDPDNIPAEMAKYGALIAGMTTIQRMVLVALLDNMFSENRRTDTQICADLGIGRNTILRTRNDRQFQEALAIISRDLMHGNIDTPIATLFEHAKKDPKVAVDYLKVSGFYVQQSKNVNLNANFSATSQDFQPASPQQYSDQVTSNYMSMGYDLQSMIDALTESWHNLKKQGM